MNAPVTSSMELIYPQPDSKIFIPMELDGTLGKVVLEAAHRDPASSIYWHLDGEYAGITQRLHQLSCFLTEGKHTLTLVDGAGEIVERQIDILSKH